MVKTIKVDMHFHPDLPRNDEKAVAKAGEIWKRIGEVGLDAIAVTEHCNKDPEQAYNFMLSTKPSKSKVVLFAGVEISTRDKFHIIIINKHEEYPKRNSLYLEKRFLEWKTKTSKEIIDLAKQKGFEVFIPHPYATFGAVKALGEKNTELLIRNKNIGVSFHCGGFFSQLKQMMEKLRIYRLMGKGIEKIYRTPGTLTKNASFIVGESDAHMISELGSAAVIDLNGNSIREAVFKNLTPKFIKQHPSQLSLSTLLKRIFVVANEVFIANKTRIKNYLRSTKTTIS